MYMDLRILTPPQDCKAVKRTHQSVILVDILFRQRAEVSGITRQKIYVKIQNKTAQLYNCNNCKLWYPLLYQDSCRRPQRNTVTVQAMLIQGGTVFSLLTYFHLCYEPSKCYYWLECMTDRNGEQLISLTADNCSQTTHK